MVDRVARFRFDLGVEHELLQTPSPGKLDRFSFIRPRRGGSTAAAVTLDTAIDEIRKNMADSVTRFPARPCNRRGALLLWTP